MRKVHLLMVILLFLYNVVSAENKVIRVIYKWKKNGIVHYTHILPKSVKHFTKLDPHGRKVEDYTESFGEIVKIKNKSKEKNNTKKGKKTNAEKEAEKKTKADTRKENCKIAKNNLDTLNTGEVYEKNTKGDMIRLKPEQIKNKKTNVKRDIDYFCNQNLN